MKVWVISRTYTIDGKNIDFDIIGVYKNYKTSYELSEIESKNSRERGKIKMSHIAQDEFEIED